MLAKLMGLSLIEKILTIIAIILVTVAAYVTVGPKADDQGNNGNSKHQATKVEKQFDNLGQKEKLALLMVSFGYTEHQNDNPRYNFNTSTKNKYMVNNVNRNGCFPPVLFTDNQDGTYSLAYSRTDSPAPGEPGNVWWENQKTISKKEMMDKYSSSKDEVQKVASQIDLSQELPLDRNNYADLNVMKNPASK